MEEVLYEKVQGYNRGLVCAIRDLVASFSGEPA